MKDIQNELNLIYEQTGVNITVYTANGDFVFGTANVRVPFLPSASADREKIVQEKGVTAMGFNSGSAEYIATISGDDESAHVLACLIERIIQPETKQPPENLSTEEKLRLLLIGDLDALKKNTLKTEISGLKFNHYVLSLVTKTEQMQRGLKQFLATVSDKRDITVTVDERRLVFLRAIPEDGDEYRSDSELAGVLYENIKEELRIELTVATGGIAKDADDLKECYEKAEFAYKFGRLINPTGNVYSYKDYVLIKLLSELPKERLVNCYEALLGSGESEVISDEELMNTADEFMKNSLNISETSRNMYIHRNTLIYRLDKIEKDTGLNLKNFGDAITFRLIKILNTLLKGE